MQKNHYYERIEKAVAFIENNLKEDLSIASIAERACFSKYHFIRVFSAIVGETVWDYVRKRRISKAAKELITTDKSILDLTIEYRFNSQEAFTRSFKQVYQTTPAKYRKHGMEQIAFGRSKLNKSRLNHLKSNVIMEPRIIDIQEKRLIGLKTKTSLANNKIPKLWQDFMERMAEIKNNKNAGCYELHPHDPDFRIEDFSPDTQFEKMAAVEVSNHQNPPKGMESHTLSAGKYAIFIHKGEMRNIQMSFDYIYGTWLPNSQYCLDSRDDFERYGDTYLGPDHPDSEMEIWVPIKSL